MPGTGPLRRSSGPARIKAIVGKSRVEPERHQRPVLVFLLLVILASSLGRRIQAPQLSLALLSKWPARPSDHAGLLPRCVARKTSAVPSGNRRRLCDGADNPMTLAI